MNLFVGLILRPFSKAFDLLHSAGCLGSQGSAAELHKAVVNAAFLLLGPFFLICFIYVLRAKVQSHSSRGCLQEI